MHSSETGVFYLKKQGEKRMNIQIPRGTQDILPGESEIWQFIEAKAQEVCRRYNFREIRTPIFEHTEVFTRTVGDTTDIVQKEMYTFKDRGDRDLTLRPEGTASVARSYVQHKLLDKLHNQLNCSITHRCSDTSAHNQGECVSLFNLV